MFAMMVKIIFGMLLKLVNFILVLLLFILAFASYS